MNEALLTAFVREATTFMEVAGVAVILGGAAISLILSGRVAAAQSAGAAYKALRSNLGRSILLGLELLVAADIINTVVVEPTLESVAALAGIVLIRTFLSISLQVEIEGRWPWRRSSDS
jgi:uncharacterized membrane protein